MVDDLSLDGAQTGDIAADSRTGLRLEGSQQIGDIATRDIAAGSITHHGVDPARLADLMETLIKNAWDDRQDRDVRQAKVDDERRRDRDESAMHWQMTRQRLDVVVTRLDHLDATAAETNAEARRVRVAGAVLAAVLALIIIAIIVIAIDRYYLAGGLLRSIIGAAGATGIYYVRSR